MATIIQTLVYIHHNYFQNFFIIPIIYHFFHLLSSQTGCVFRLRWSILIIIELILIITELCVFSPSFGSIFNRREQKCFYSSIVIPKVPCPYYKMGQLLPGNIQQLALGTNMICLISHRALSIHCTIHIIIGVLESLDNFFGTQF